MSAEERKASWLLPGGLGVLVVGLVAIALLRGQVSLDPETPAGAVQEYLVAINAERWDDAIEIIHDDWRGGCQGSDIDSFAPGEFSAELGTHGGMSGRMTEESFVAVGGEDEVSPTPTVPDDATRVEVTIHHDSGGLGSGWNEPVTFELVEEEGFWWITGDPWPFFTWSCRG